MLQQQLTLLSIFLFCPRANETLVFINPDGSPIDLEFMHFYTDDFVNLAHELSPSTSLGFFGLPMGMTRSPGARTAALMLTKEQQWCVFSMTLNVDVLS
jgi:hypothetical protein